jgi:arylsulfatase A-like enzyme
MMADQFHAACLSALGSQVRTPNLDRLAEDGAMFTGAYCNFPVCGPSRASFMTGQYPRSHGVLGNNIFNLPIRNPDTLPAVFRRTGFQTGIVGKSHSVKLWDEEAYEFIRYSDLTDGDWIDPLKNHYFKHLYDNGLAHLYDLNDVPDKQPFISQIPEQHSLERWTGDRAMEFLQQRDESRPFFLHLSFQRPHNPLTTPFDRGMLYNPEDIELPESAKDLFDNEFAGKPAYFRDLLNRRGKGSPYTPHDERDLKHHLAFYYGLITMIDEQIGRVIDYLKATGQYDDTVIVFTSDHGDFGGEHGLMLKSVGINESLHHIPFILKYPGIRSAQRIDGFMESVDVYPTLCELAHVPVPDERDGRSVIPLLEGTSAGKPYVVCETGGRRQTAIRTKQFRLVFNGSGKDGELYNLAEDPLELHNVYDQPGYRETRLELLEILFDYMKQYRNLTPDRNENRNYRNGMTRLIHKHQIGWSQLEDLYQQ